MAESAALLVDEVLAHELIRQWVLSFPFQLRFLLASRPAITGQVLGIAYRAISTHLVKKAGYSTKTADVVFSLNTSPVAILPPRLVSGFIRPLHLYLSAYYPLAFKATFR